ncbi:MAG TPA: hypothetical protein VKV77_06770 [Methylovirgula sp.]|nr:hypothetical protein [Methylovirgula sp.]
MREKVQEGFEVFAHDGETAFGAVRQVAPHGRPEFIVYVENAGDYAISLEAVLDVHDGKVVVDCNKLDPRLKQIIGHAHDAEDPNYEAP